LQRLQCSAPICLKKNTTIIGFNDTMGDRAGPTDGSFAPHADQRRSAQLAPQTLDINQIAQAHPLILCSMGTGMAKGMSPGECCNTLTVELKQLTTTPGLLEAGQRTTHIGQGPVEVDPLGGTCGFSHH
jgi:hypothetical protein